MFEYKIIKVDGAAGLSACDSVNQFLAKNPDWKLWNVVTFSTPDVAFILERPLKNAPESSPPAGGLKEGAKLSENVLAFPKRAAA
jgi:hypothetical protein